MASTGALRERIFTRGRGEAAAIPADSLQLDRIMAVVVCLITFGLFIDGWAHNHGQVDDSFFTPWHALLYGAVGLAGLILIVTQVRNVGKGFAFASALPMGYRWSLIGFFMFAAGGVFDIFWHEAFGFEEGTEALISPSHLYLALSGLLIVGGPVRAAWQRRSDNSWSQLLPAILTFTCLTSIFLFFTAYAAVTNSTSMLTGPRPGSTRVLDAIGIVAFISHSNILLGALLVMARRWRLPFGAATLLFGGSAALMTWLRVQHNEEFLWVIFAAAVGLLADWLLQRGALETAAGTRIFAIVIPFAYSLGALIAIEILGSSVWGEGGMWWLIHMWLGVPIMAAAVGYGLSLLMSPPPAPAK